MDGGGVLDRIRRATGLDRLDVQSSNRGTAGQALSGGKYLGEDVYVGLEQGATASSSKAKVEVKVFPNVTVDSTVGADAQSDIGVNWKWKY
jgi:translocation and assembly module TamB